MNNRSRIPVWFVTKQQASVLPPDYYSALQNQFNNALDISPDMESGMIRIHAPDENDRGKLQSYMHQHVPDVQPRLCDPASL